MIKRVGFNHFPNKGSNISKQGNNLTRQFNNYPKQINNPSKSSKNLLKPSTGLPKSTKTLFIFAIAMIVIVILFFIIRGIINGNKDETPIDKLNADLKISEVQVLNYTDISFKVDGNMSKGNVDSINLIIYNENDSVILRKKILISDLERNDFYINIHITNTSKIKEISVTPTFVDEEGKKVFGEVEDEYTLTDEEKYNYNGKDKLPEEETPACILDYECDDNNACTTDNCAEGECSHTDIVDCIPCKLSSECEDSITCTTNTCSNGKCSYLAIPGCVSCASALDCDDSNSCTENICSGGRCLYTPMESCVSCSLDSECEDNDICTENICSNGACSFIAISGCKSCSSNFQCNDSDFSTKDSCSNGKCNYAKINSCINNDNYCPDSCTILDDDDCPYVPVCGNGIREGDEKCDGISFGGATCAGVLGVGYTGTLKCTKICTFNTSLCAPPCTCSNDNNICTADGCVNNVCQHVPLTGNSCVSDNNICTNDICSSTGTCKHIPLTGNSCTDDNNICTNDVCSSNGVCTHPAIPGCCLSNAQCTNGKTCVNNACVTSCTDTCSSLGYNCGTKTICGVSKNCGSCSGTCTNNVCIKPPTPALRTFYISPSGSDSNSGTSASSAWRTLAHACASATRPGDLIFVKTGTYVEDEECELAVGVSIEGEGIGSVIKSHFQTERYGGINHASISLVSSEEGTDGDQSISNIKLDGDGWTGSIGILVKKRSNVKIHDLTIVNFYVNGVTFLGKSEYEEPSVYATGNELYNSIITNCGQEDGNWDGGGLIQIGGQDGMLIHDNILTETGMPGGKNGNILCGAYYNKGVKYYRNKSYKPDYNGEYWNFHFEIWDTVGGFEIYDNEFHGGDTPLDFGGHFNTKGDYSYSYYVHDNLFTRPSGDSEGAKYAICIEGPSTKDVWIYRNHFLNIPTAIQVCEGGNEDSVESGIYIGYNIFEKSGWDNPRTWDVILEFVHDRQKVSTISDVYIYNNIIIGDGVTHSTAISIDIGADSVVSNFNVINNIIMNNDNGAFFSVKNPGKIDGVYINNNILYNNQNSNDPKFEGNTIRNYDFSGNIKADPKFFDESNGDFDIMEGSPAIDAGVDLNLPESYRDYEGNPVPRGDGPDIGAYETNY